MDRSSSPDGVVATDHGLALGDGMGTLPVLWWVPIDRPVIGVAWLQHGYARKPHYLSSLAGVLTAQGLVVAMPTVESFRRARSINDAAFIDAIGSALAKLSAEGGPLRAVLGEVGVEIGDVEARRLVLVAHSAGCAVVARAGARALADGAKLDGIVLLDATDNLAKTFVPSLDGLATTVVRGVFAQPSWCNRKGQGAKALLAARSGYVGVRLTTGTHCDAEGRDTDRVCRTMCGKPDPANVDVLFEATAAWTRDLTLGRTATAWEPGGERLEDEIGVGRVEALYAADGASG